MNLNPIPDGITFTYERAPLRLTCINVYKLALSVKLLYVVCDCDRFS